MAKRKGNLNSDGKGNYREGKGDAFIVLGKWEEAGMGG